MIYTTYFAQLRNLPPNITPISIAGKSPDWYNGLKCPKLAPKYGFFSEWKKTGDNDYYIQQFTQQVLDTLNAQNVVYELMSIAQNQHVALVCYEAPGKFCHRHLVAQWLHDNGFNCQEWVQCK